MHFDTLWGGRDEATSRKPYESAISAGSRIEEKAYSAERPVPVGRRLRSGSDRAHDSNALDLSDFDPSGTEVFLG